MVIVRNLDQAPTKVQIQVLELMRTRRIFTRIDMQSAPRHFLIVALLGDERSEGGAAPRVEFDALNKHLRDFLFISHWHDLDDGLPNLEELSENDGEAVHSVLGKSPSKEDIEEEGEPVRISQEVGPSPP